MIKKKTVDLSGKDYSDLVVIDKGLKKYKCPIVIAGPDNFYEDEYIAAELSSLIDYFWSQRYGLKDMCIVSSGRKGTELVAEKLAQDFGIDVMRFDPDYEKLGRKMAGKVNHYKMCKYAFDAMKNRKTGWLLVFFDGKSERLLHMIETARKYKLNVRQVAVMKRTMD